MPGSHRGRPRRLRAFAPAALASVVAVVLVIAAIVLVDVFHHRGSSTTGSPAVSSSVTLSATSPNSISPTPSPTPTATHTSAKPKTTPTKTAKPTQKPSAAIVTPAPASTPVAVFNNSRVAHRAALAASRLRADGYPVTRTATRPTYPGANVVYYPAGNASLAAAARGLVAKHIGIVGAEPRPASIPAMAGLIVVVTSSYT